MAVDHYENFPVASLLLPARLRPPVQAIYAFARSADDLADEGDASPSERLAALAAYGALLDRIGDSVGEAATGSMAGVAADQVSDADLPPIFAALRQTVIAWQLPLAPFHALLSAFSQDVLTHRYADYDALRDYCRRSADPVGELMLHLYGMATPANLQRSAAICTALQIINFLQDVAIDLAKGRIYLPQTDLVRFGIAESGLAKAVGGPAWRALMAFEVDRVRQLMCSGADLAVCLPGRIGWELRLVVQGGLRILARIEAADYDVFRHRPQLGPADWIAIGWAALRMRRRQLR